MKIVNYAPVIIPTLNRYEHFKRCLESLEHCTGANKTDIYVGLDYPPSEKYVDGWEKIDRYLVDKEKKNCFNNLIVCRRKYNCGMGKPGSNYDLLKKDVEKISDRFIFSEDDNEFSPCFLEFMNKALEFYRDDPMVLYVSAYTSPIFKGMTSDKTFFGIDTPAYGLGQWSNKKEADLYSNEELSKDLCKSFKKSLRLFWTYPAIFGMALFMIKKNAQYGDVRRSMYNMFHHTYTLQPSTSLTRNWGCDGSGLHSGFVLGREKEDILDAFTFDIQDIAHGYSPTMLKRIFFLNMPTNYLHRIKLLFMTFICFFHFYLKKNLF